MTPFFNDVTAVVVGGVLLLVLLAIIRRSWSKIVVTYRRTKAWWLGVRFRRQQRRDEGGRLTTGENRHRRCVHRDDEIVARKPGQTYYALGPCTACNEPIRPTDVPPMI